MQTIERAAQQGVAPDAGWHDHEPARVNAIVRLIHGGADMVWPFSKNSRKLALPTEDEQRWGLAQGEFEGAPVIVRYNVTARAWAGHPDLPVKLGFAIPFNRPNATMPDPGENAELGPTEDLIVREVLSVTRGVYALTLTTGVMKEFVFYIAPGADIAALHASIRNQVATHDVQCMAVEERNWDSYRTFVREQ